MKAYKYTSQNKEKLAEMIKLAKQNKLDFTLKVDDKLFIFCGGCVMEIDGDTVYGFPNGQKEVIDALSIRKEVRHETKN